MLYYHDKYNVALNQEVYFDSVVCVYSKKEKN